MDLLAVFTGGFVNAGNLVTNFLFCACTVILLGDLRLQVKSILINALEAVLLFIFASAIEVAVAGVTRSDDGSSGSLVFLCITMALYAAIQRKRTVTDRIVLCVTFVSAVILATSMTGIMLRAFPTLKQVSWGYSFPGYVSYCIMLLFAVVLRIFSIERFTFIPRYFVVLIVLIDVLGAYAGYSFIAYSITHMGETGDTYSSLVLTRYEQNMALINVQIDVTFLLLMLVSYLMFYVLAREHAQRAELLVTQKSDADTLSQMLVTRQIYDSLRETRHELKNYNAYMRTLLDAGDYEGLKKFFNAYGSELEELLDYVSSGNRTIDAVVNAKLALARSHGIELKTVLAVPSGLSIADDDMFRLLANLLDNAIEGTLESPMSKGPIHLKIMPHGGYFIISVSNPCNPKKVRRTQEGTFRTTKADDTVHGYGTRVIREIAEKYQGSAQFSVKHNIFSANVMLVAHAMNEGE